jgi:hypothetical protein
LLEAWHPRIDEVGGLLQALGYHPTEAFDPAICRAFSLTAGVEDTDD